MFVRGILALTFLLAAACGKKGDSGKFAQDTLLMRDADLKNSAAPAVDTNPVLRDRSSGQVSPALVRPGTRVRKPAQGNVVQMQAPEAPLVNRVPSGLTPRKPTPHVILPPPPARPDPASDSVKRDTTSDSTRSSGTR